MDAWALGFFPGGTTVDFPGVANRGEIKPYPLETKRTFFFCLIGKYQISKSSGDQAPLRTPMDG